MFIFADIPGAKVGSKNRTQADIAAIDAHMAWWHPYADVFFVDSIAAELDLSPRTLRNLLSRDDPSLRFIERVPIEYAGGGLVSVSSSLSACRTTRAANDKRRAPEARSENMGFLDTTVETPKK